MPIINEYLEYCRDTSSAGNLTDATFEFLMKKDCDITLIEHNPAPIPIKIINTNNDKTLEEWLKHFGKITAKITDPVISNGNYDYYFSNINFQSTTIYLFAAKSNQSLIKEILSVWQSLINMQENVYVSSKQDTENAYGNLISQFMHDIQSLIDSNKSADDEIVKRINYQKKLNKDLLFFIRDFDLFKTEIPVKSFVNDSLKLLDLEPGSIKTEFEDKELKINIDVELFSETINVVINNAINATRKDLSKIALKVYSLQSGSPFFKQNWTVFEVTDFGNGIAEEFEPFISKPFFTTHKHDGHTGFGLSNAEKIITAHNGFLDISTGSGTIIKIYMPQKNNEKK